MLYDGASAAGNGFIFIRAIRATARCTMTILCKITRVRGLKVFAYSRYDSLPISRTQANVQLDIQPIQFSKFPLLLN